MWEIICFGGGDFIARVLNAIAMIFGNDDYSVAMNTAALLGFIAVIIKMAFDKDGFHNFKWLMGIILFYMALVVPKETVNVIDRHDPSQNQTVANVPIGIAMTAGTISLFSDWLVTEFDTAFSMPNMSYLNHDALYSYNLLKGISEARIKDQRTSSNFVSFFTSCVVIDGIGNDRMTWDSIMQSGNLFAYLEPRLAQWAAYFNYTNPDGSTQIFPCYDGYVNGLINDITAAIDPELNILARRLYPTTTQAAARTQLDTDGDAIISSIMGVPAATLVAIAVQAAQLNLIDDSLIMFAKETQTSDVFNDYVINRAEVERQTSFMASARNASTKLPILKLIFEAFIYAIFPIVVLMALVSPVKVSFAYLKALLWIGMWGPIYALLNYAFSYFGSNEILSLTSLFSDGSGLSLLASNEYTESINDVAATAGFMFLSVPVIAWLFVSQSGAMMASMAGRVLQSYDDSINRATQEQVSGTKTMHGITMQQTTDGDSFMSGYDRWGNQTSVYGDNSSNINYSSDKGLMTVAQDVKQSTAQLNDQLNNMRQVATEQGRQATSAINDQTMASQALVNQVTSGQNVNDVRQTSTGHRVEEAASKMAGVIASKLRNEGVQFTDTQEAQLAARLSFGKDPEKPGGRGDKDESAIDKVLDKVTDKASGAINIASFVMEKLGIGVNAGVNVKTSASETDAYNRATNILTDDKFTRALNEYSDASKALAHQLTKGNADSDTSTLNEAVSRANSSTDQYRETMHEADSLQRSVSMGQAINRAMTTDRMAETKDNAIRFIMNRDGVDYDKAEDKWLDTVHAASTGGSIERLELQNLIESTLDMGVNKDSLQTNQPNVFKHDYDTSVSEREAFLTEYGNSAVTAGSQARDNFDTRFEDVMSKIPSPNMRREVIKDIIEGKEDVSGKYEKYGIDYQSMKAEWNKLDDEHKALVKEIDSKIDTADDSWLGSMAASPAMDKVLGMFGMGSESDKAPDQPSLRGTINRN